jgi:quinol monooxygenase YgiN
MNHYRRKAIIWMAGLTAGLPVVSQSEGSEIGGQGQMYGLIGKIVSTAGRRDELASILINGISGMPGCLSYVVSHDTNDEQALWITEVWENKGKHQASLALESVQIAIKLGKPLIESFKERFETIPIGGQGI